MCPPYIVLDLQTPKIHEGRPKLLEIGNAACQPVIQQGLGELCFVRLSPLGVLSTCPVISALPGQLGAQYLCAAPIARGWDLA